MPGPGRKELRSIRLRAEATNGTRVSPRFIWRGKGEMPDDQRTVTKVEEEIGKFGGTDRTYIPKLMAEIPLAETEATFEQIPDIFMMCGLGTSGGGNRAGSAQGASGSAVVFTLPVPEGSGPVSYSYTMEAGDDAWAEYLPYVLCKELTLNFNGGEGVMLEATLFGRFSTATNAEGSFSNVGTLVSVETIIASRGSVWLTPVGSGFGTGQVTAGNILGGQLKITPNWEPKHPIDSGNLYFHTAVFTGIDIEGELTFEHQVSGTYGAAGSAGQKEKWRAEEAQLMRLQWNGGTIPLGTTYQNKMLRIDLPIKYDKFEPLDDQNGNGITTAAFTSRFNEDTPSAGRGTVTVVRLGTSEFSGAN